MIQSMTAFAQHQKQLENGQLIWELRAVNSRYLDVFFRVPEELRVIEMSLRAILRSQIHRGKLECHLRYQEAGSSSSAIHLNQPILDSLLELSQQLTERYALANDVTVSQVLAWPGVLQADGVKLDRLREVALLSFKEALAQLLQSRTREGKAIQALLFDRLEELKQILTESYTLFASLAPQSKEKLLVRLNALPFEVSAARVEEELAIILTRLDVREELDRIQTHIKEVERVLHQERLIGRKFDFLMQELQREANTLSAKSDSIALTQQAVAMKVCIEQMREQIQNIE